MTNFHPYPLVSYTEQFDRGGSKPIGWSSQLLNGLQKTSQGGKAIDSSNNVELTKWIRASLAKNIPLGALKLKFRNWGMSDEQAFELANECGAEAFRRCIGRDFNDLKHFQAWLVVTATNVAIDNQRKQAKTSNLGLLVNSLVENITNDEAVTNQLERAISELSEDERRVVEEYYFMNLTLDEIGRGFDFGELTSSNAMRLRIKRIRDRGLSNLRILFSSEEPI